MKPMSRHELADAIAIDRAEYERTYAHLPRGWQPLAPYVRAAAIRIARNSERGVAGIRIVGTGLTVSVYCRVDFEKLTATVERRLPMWRETLDRVDGPVANHA